MAGGERQCSRHDAAGHRTGYRGRGGGFLRAVFQQWREPDVVLWQHLPCPAGRPRVCEHPRATRGAAGANDCRWSLFERTNDGWQRRQADPAGRTREPAPLACLPPSAEHPAGRVLLSANPTLLAPGVAGPGPARPELLVFDAAVPGTPPVVLAPAWQETPAFSEHSYRSLAVDRRRGEVFMMQYADATHGDWSFRDRNGGWHAGRIAWPPYAAGDLAPFNASHGRVNYPVVAVRDGGVHVFGPVAHDNWSRVKTPADLQLPGPPGKPKTVKLI